jgi:hypothetical protein
MTLLTKARVSDGQVKRVVEGKVPTRGASHRFQLCTAVTSILVPANRRLRTIGGKLACKVLLTMHRCKMSRKASWSLEFSTHGSKGVVIR